MADKRMFSKQITDSDAFLDMPLSTQSLYFHLGMAADDDGFVNSPKRTQRIIGCSNDDFNLLIAKGFLIPFESGVVVIKHWKINNYIRSDRYKETAYTEEKALLTTKENGAYSLVGIPDGSQVVYADKNSIEEIRLDKNICPKSKELHEEFERLWHLYPKKQGKDKAYKYYEKARKSDTTYEEVEDGIMAYQKYINANKIEMQYVKMGSTFFSQKAWSDDWTIINRTASNANPFLEMLENGDY